MQTFCTREDQDNLTFAEMCSTQPQHTACNTSMQWLKTPISKVMNELEKKYVNYDFPFHSEFICTVLFTMHIVSQQQQQKSMFQKLQSRWKNHLYFLDIIY